MPLRIFHNIHRVFKIRSELEEVYINLVMQSFSIALIGIFIPIFLLKVGFSLNLVIVYMIITWTSFGVFIPVSAKMSSMLGVKHTILLSVPVLILFFLLLLVIPGINPDFLYMVGIAYGIQQAMYWIPLHSEFIKNTDKIHENEEIGNLIALPKIAAIIAPIIGALILQNLGFNFLFIIVIFLLILSVWPLFLTNDYKGNFRFKLKDIEFGLERNLSLGYLLNGILFISEALMWPVFIYEKFGNLLYIGIATAVCGVGIAIFTLFIGRFGKRFNHRRLLWIGALIYSVTWFARLFVTTAMEVFLLSFLGGMFATIIHLTMYVSFTGFARKRNEVACNVYREFWLSVGRISSLVFLFFVIHKFIFAFLLAGFVSIFYLFVRLNR